MDSNTILDQSVQSINKHRQLAKLSGVLRKTRTITSSDVTLYDYDSGEVIFLAITGSSDIAITLPTPAVGLYFTFINAATPSGSGDAVITPTGTDTIVAMSAADSGADGASNLLADTVTIEAASIGGERLDVVCDGTFWYCYVHQNAIGSVTFAG